MTTMINFKYFLIFHVLYSQIHGWDAFYRGSSMENIEKFLKVKKLTFAGANVQEKWFTQQLDHFNAYDTRTWQQLYLTNDQYFSSPNGPIFIMLGAEGDASPSWLVGGTWVRYATRFRALLVYIEHRFYGRSHPTNDTDTENLRYLTSEQALADAAAFIGEFKKTYPNNKWIVFGGSYGGNLAAWFRLKYPHLVQGSVSSSSPVKAELDFIEYYKVVSESLATYSNECVTAIRNGNREVSSMLQSTNGRRTLTTKFNLCSPIEASTDPRNDVLFQMGLAVYFASAVQYNNPNSNYSINSLCRIMTNRSIPDPIDRLADVNRVVLTRSHYSCMSYNYASVIKYYQYTPWHSGSNGRAWTFQTCNEFGYYPTSFYVPQNFGNSFPIEFFSQLCVDIFGPTFNAHFTSRAVNRTNLLNGGFDYDGTNVVFVHGSIDPWHALGITSSINRQNPVIFIQGTAHCEDMAYSDNIGNLPQLTAAIVIIGEYINSWLNFNM